jgi:hypothetical protein
LAILCGGKMNRSDYGDYQANVHFALATIIQGITIALLGVAFAGLIQSVNWPQTGFLLLTSLQSLALAISFWYAFVMAYFHLFRVLRMTAVDHLVLSYVYFSIGLMQIVGFQFLENPRVWLTINCVLVITALFYAQFINFMVRREEKQQTQREEPLSGYLSIHAITKTLIVMLVITVILLLFWYVAPVLNTPLYAFVCLFVFAILIIIYNIAAVKNFQARLDHPNPTNLRNSS